MNTKDEGKIEESQEFAPRSSGASPPLEPREKRKRRNEAIAISLLALIFILLTLAEFRISNVSSSLPFVNSIFFFGLLNVNIVILIALVWLVFRNIGKLLIERRKRVLGSSLKTKLVIAFLGFSIIPTLVLFVISALYINSSFDKWFSIKIQNTLQASLEITGSYYRNTEETAMHFAEHIASELSKKIPKEVPYEPIARVLGTPEAVEDPLLRLRAEQRYRKQVLDWIAPYIRNQRELLALDSIEYYSDPIESRLVAARTGGGDRPDVYPRLSLDVLERAFSGEKLSTLQHIGAGDLIRCLVPLRKMGGDRLGGVVVVSAYIPVSLKNKVGEIASVFDDYKETNPLKYPMKTTYLVILIMITLVLLFTAIWLGLFMARELTVPVERLVAGARAVGAGDLDVSVLEGGQDEIGVLVQSFNRMTSDLRENRTRLLQAREDLERRRLELEAILTNVGTGVIAIDNDGKVTTFNRAAAALLDLSESEVLYQNYQQIFGGTRAVLCEVIDHALSALTKGQAVREESAQLHFKRAGESHVYAIVAKPLRERGTNWGAVVVIDDLTHLIKGQRETAWREVARRIAHEIKNPLTPIKLSAQRIQRRMGDYRGKDAEILKECTGTIIKHTDELKEMVNEFSNFARFPEISPTPNQLNVALQEVIQLYRSAHQSIQIQEDLDQKLPVFEFDRDQIKRVLINLLDNAVAALSSMMSASPRVFVASHYNSQLEIAVIEVRDNGPGMTDEVRERVFEPYFSTKAEGTGLGLAIAKRIINDHDGYIRVTSSLGEGTRFLIELPTASKKTLEVEMVRGAEEREL